MIKPIFIKFKIMFLNIMNFSFKPFFQLISFKLIVLFCTIYYLIFFTIFAYLGYKAYILALEDLVRYQSLIMTTDIGNLIYNFP